MNDLVDRIEQRIRDLPASNPGYISVVPSTLAMVLDQRLLRKIAEAAAYEALSTPDGIRPCREVCAMTTRPLTYPPQGKG